MQKIVFECPFCSMEVQATAELFGTKQTCFHCENEIIVPNPNKEKEELLKKEEEERLKKEKEEEIKREKERLQKEEEDRLRKEKEPTVANLLKKIETEESKANKKKPKILHLALLVLLIFVCVLIFKFWPRFEKIDYSDFERAKKIANEQNFYLSEPEPKRKKFNGINCYEFTYINQSNENSHLKIYTDFNKKVIGAYSHLDYKEGDNWFNVGKYDFVNLLKKLTGKDYHIYYGPSSSGEKLTGPVKSEHGYYKFEGDTLWYHETFEYYLKIYYSMYKRYDGENEFNYQFYIFLNQ